MPTVNIDTNINDITSKIEKMSQEIFRLQGVLHTFKGFKASGLENIELPNSPNQTSTEDSVEDLTSIQEKPE